MVALPLAVQYVCNCLLMCVNTHVYSRCTGMYMQMCMCVWGCVGVCDHVCKVCMCVCIHLQLLQKFIFLNRNGELRGHKGGNELAVVVHGFNTSTWET